MISRFATVLVTAALLVSGFAGAGCASKKAPIAGGKTTATYPVGHGGGDCYGTAGAPACPADATDPSGKKLPAVGGHCVLAPCKPCGSATAPAYRDPAGLAQAGWCLCVPQSDDSGVGIYSCFTPAEWAARGS
ncbi:MAG: hypothetical protein ABUS79_00910 [Pseudomonadota bacterium]